MRRWLLVLSLVITCWEVRPCWGENTVTVTTTMSESSFVTLTYEACHHEIWKFRATPEACQQGDDAVLRYMLEKIVATGSMGRIRGLGKGGLDATVEIVHGGGD